jgi:Beta-lactamase superfamily domain
MRIEYLAHAGLAIETADALLVTDPWLDGPAYCGQWWLHPKPIDTSRVDDADCVLVTHGHEDHLHVPTLDRLRRKERFLYPYTWYGGIGDFARSLGFHRVDEAITGRTYEIAPRTRVTYLANNLDSIVVVESEGRVLVNVNDALHCQHPRVIDLFVEAIKRRWPQIDTVFCGFGGASHFPNTIHLAGKDDEEVGRLREQLFVHGFCRIVAGLAPRVAVPFAADFALLDPQKLWINRIRFRREDIPAYYAEQFGAGGGAPSIVSMYPGDALVNDELDARSPYRAELEEHGSLDHLLERQYAGELEEKRRRDWLEPDGCEIHVADRQAVIQRLDTACVKLLTRHPAASRHARREPVRAARFLLHNPLTSRWALARLRGGRELRSMYDSELWLSRTKCEICQVCDLPLLDAALAESL